MLSDDLTPFLAPANLEDPARASDHFDRCTGVAQPALEELQREILADLSVDSHGISWWQPFLEKRERILIADHLLECPRAVIHNLVEANLHFLEAKSAWADHARRMSRVFDAGGNVALPPYTRGADDLPERLASLHIAGAFRAVGSVLDCLAALAIGVLPVPVSIIKADFRSLRSWLRGERAKGVARSARQTEFRDALEASITASGPPGWLEWADDYRNTLVHRPRRIELYVLRPESFIVDSQSRPLPHAEVVRVLTAEPDLSDVEALQKDTFSLNEDARHTISGLLRSVHMLSSDVGTHLLATWRSRREFPDRQPTEHWLAREATIDNFSGYRPGSVPTNPRGVLTSRQWVKRLAAAALTDDKTNVWKPRSK